MTTLRLTDRDDELPRRQRDEEVLRIRWSMVFQVVGYVVGLFIMWNTLTNRMTAMESREDALRGEIAGLKGDIFELRTDIKTLLSRKP